MSAPAAAALPAPSNGQAAVWVAPAAPPPPPAATVPSALTSLRNQPRPQQPPLPAALGMPLAEATAAAPAGRVAPTVGQGVGRVAL